MDARGEGELGPWNPGLSSRLPAGARELATIYRPENIFGNAKQAQERSAFTGLEPEDLVAFRPERLVIHELLIRVTGDFSIPDGKRYADLGINFRSVVETILKQDISSVMPEIVERFDRLRDDLRLQIENEFARLQRHPLPTIPPPRSKNIWQRWFGFKKSAGDTPQLNEHMHDDDLVAEWRREGAIHPDPMRRRLCRALAQVASAVSIKHGRLPTDKSTIAEIALDRVMNDHGSALVGDIIEPHIAKAVEREGYRLLPVQAEPVVMNVKGASAAGKSTLRPLQRKLAERLGISWTDFALISPDIWRKYLLDYDSLGEFWRYAGTLTGHELKIVDQKLDRYMSEKAKRNAIPHLLIDRFRFDSFAETEGGEEGARLLTRFGSTIYMFFVITPPDATVERAWKRGLEFGRFKAVDDLLHHNVEAFTGMPDLFFTWALKTDKNVHYEFLDNGVPLGERPRTVAYGWNGDMTLLDIKRFLDVDRFKRIDIDATSPDALYPDADGMAPENNTVFLKRCARHIAKITVAERDTGRIIAVIKHGCLTWIDEDAFNKAVANRDMAAGMEVLAPETMRSEMDRASAPVFLDMTEAQTLGSR